MKFKTQLIAVNVLLMVFLCVISVVMYRATNGLIENNAWVTHTSIVISKANALGKAIADMETGQRGFMLTSNETFLEPFIAGKQTFAQTVEHTMDLVSDNPPQVKRLQKIQQLKERWLKSAGEYEIDLKRKVDQGALPQEALAHVLQGNTIDGMPQPEGHQTGKNIIDKIRNRLAEFIVVEDALMQYRTEDSETASAAAENLAVFGAILALFFGGGATIVMRRRLMGQLGADPSALIAMSQSVAHGTLSTRVELEEATETSTINVAETLNHMAETLQTNIETLQDQTEALKSSQEELLDYQHQIQGINNSQSVIQFYPDGRILSANSIFLEVMGYREEEIYNQHHRMFVAEAEGASASYQQFWQDLAAGTEKRGEFQRFRKDGQVVWLQATYTPIKDPSGTIFKIVKYATDVTAQKRQIEHHNQFMEQAKNDIEEKARELELVLQYKSEFFATMSHEIRTPMNGIIGMTDMLLDSSLDLDQRNCAETVKHSADALLTILNDILDFSKIESGKLQLEVIDFDLRVVVDEVMDLLGGKGQEKGLELVGLVYASVPRAVRGDPGRLRQILLNLVGNAIKFTEEGEVVVQVLVETETGERVQLRVEVSDTGIGLLPEARERLFQPFTQADSTTTRRFGGTGLGLSICRQLVECMGGTIHVDSQIGQGSRFWFTIELEKQTNSLVIDKEAEYDLDGLRVCIVVENTKTQLQLSEYVNAWGMSCLVAENELAVLRLLKEAVAQDQPCNFLFVDRHMPRMDGLELAQQVRTDPGLSGIQIVMLTSMGHRGDAADAQAVGVEAYLSKPIHYDRLRTCLSLVRNGSSTTNTQPITQHTIREATPRTGSYVLVAEDNLVNQKVVVRMLKKLHYRVDVVGNGLEALEAVSRIAYDAVLMDCQMPEMDGFEATKNIREAERKKLEGRSEKEEIRNNRSKEFDLPSDISHLTSHSRIPIIALTANAMKGDREQCLEAGMDDFLSKPVQLDVLENKLEQWIGTSVREELAVESQT